MVQALFEHKNGEQSITWASWQVPCPSQTRAVFWVTLAAQLAAPHGVFSGKRAQAPAPSQRPVVSQVETSFAGQRESGTPAPKSLQRPTESASLHDRHAPVQATLQQYPSAQWPEAQSSLPPGHGKPFSFKPQRLAEQVWSAAQSELSVHCPAHWLVFGSHVYGAHGTLTSSEQEPLPSQALAFTTPSPSQVPFLQRVCSSYLRHAPTPSQVPSWPQVDCASAAQKLGSVGLTPAGMKAQMPSELGRLHVLQPSVQAESQQRLFTQ